MTGAWLGPHRLSGMVAPMLAWAVHFVAVYGIQGLACARGWDRRGFAGHPVVTWWLLVLTVAMLAVAAGFGLAGWRAWRAARTGTAAAGADEAGLRRFTAGGTALLALLAMVAICFTAIPILLLPTCS